MAAALPLQVDIEVEQGVSVFGGPGATAVAAVPAKAQAAVSPTAAST